MKTEELEKQIHDYICNTFSAKYTGLLKVTHENGFYSLILGIPSNDLSTIISYQTNDEKEFLDYIQKELRLRKYTEIKFIGVKLNNDKNGVQ